MLDNPAITLHEPGRLPQSPNDWACWKADVWHATISNTGSSGVRDVMKRSFLGGFLAFLGSRKATAQQPKAQFPPVPLWRPSFPQPLDRVIDRITYYSNSKLDFAVFENATCVLLDAGMSDIEAKTFALSTLSDIFGHHPDMKPTTMDDGNVLVNYNRPAVNVVLKDVAQAHWPEIEARYLDGLARAEVLFTPLGRNTFDAFGKQALLGRAYMFMDAQAPKIVEIKRHV